MRTYGISGLQDYIRHHINLAKRFEQLVLKDKRFEVCNEVKLGLVCFRLKGSDRVNEKLLETINGSGKLHMVPASVNEKFTIRFCVVAQNASEEDIGGYCIVITDDFDFILILFSVTDYAWDVITDFASELLEKEQNDEVTEIAPKLTLAQKRSFFVRMVSDPKLYNPAINKSGTSRLSQEITTPTADGTMVTIHSPPR
jgi:glutamate/tyrosine decarboxylase-like PLP-dependent enzyme